MHRSLTFLAATLLAGCASAPPPLAATNPASPQAPEGARIARTTSLRSDDPTRITNKLLSAAQKEQEHWDAYGPVSGTREAAPKTEGTMDMSHEH